MAKIDLLESRGRRPRTGTIQTCTNCKEEYYRSPSRTTLICSRPCYWESMKGKPAHNKGASYPQLKGEKNHGWKEKVSYSGVHRWLYRNYGKANHCEALLCERRSKHYEWALLDGHEYEKNIANYKQLCSVCHHAYDRIAEKRWGRG